MDTVICKSYCGYAYGNQAGQVYYYVRGFYKIELNMWEFNTGAFEFYKAAGFKTFRRYLEYDNR